MSAPIMRAVRRDRRAVRAADRVRRRAGRCSTRRAARQRAQQAARCSRSCTSSAGRSSPATAACWRAACAGAGGTYGRTYPAGSLFAQPVGYAIVALNQLAGLERYRNDELHGPGRRARLARRPAAGQAPEGDDVVTTLDPAGAADRDRPARRERQPGAVVALDPRTGAVLVMARTPGYDPNTLNRPGVFRALNSADSGAPLLNRVDAARTRPARRSRSSPRRPRSTAASTRRTRSLNGDSPKVISRRAAGQRPATRASATITLTTALTNSVNTVFAQVGETLGTQTMAEYMQRFGFYRRPPLDYPADEMLASGESAATGKLLPVTSDQRRRRPRRRSGRASSAVTPLQMAMVASRGRQRRQADGAAPRRPHRRPGRPRRSSRIEPQRRRAGRCRQQTADEVTQMMTHGRRRGHRHRRAARRASRSPARPAPPRSATPARTSPSRGSSRFAPADNPRIAIAVTVETHPTAASAAPSPPRSPRRARVPPQLGS